MAVPQPTAAPAKGKWPKGLEPPHTYKGTLWSLSPEVDIGGHQLRVCVMSRYHGSHTVYVFVDGAQKYPGGSYSEEDSHMVKDPKTFWFPFKWPKERMVYTWSGTVAARERISGGKNGPVAGRDRLIEEAKRLIEDHPLETHPELDALETKALTELMRATEKRL